MYVFWRKTEDPPSPFVRLTRTNKYLRFSANTADHWTQTGSSTHTHTASGITVGNSVHSGSTGACTGPYLDDIMGVHSDHSITEYSVANSNNNNPIGWGLDIIYVDITTWETSIRSFPEGAIVMSNGTLSEASLERYTVADGKYIVHTTPETVVGTSTPQSHTVNGTTSSVYGPGYITASMSRLDVGDRTLQHNHTFSIVSQSLYTEPRHLVTRLYHAMQNTSKAIAGTVVFVDGAVGANWRILSAWEGGNLKSDNVNPTITGSDTHTHTFSGNSSTYDGPDAFSNQYLLNRTVYDSHYHPISGTLDAANHVPPSKYIVPAELITTLKRNFESVMVVIT